MNQYDSKAAVSPFEPGPRKRGGDGESSSNVLLNLGLIAQHQTVWLAVIYGECWLCPGAQQVIQQQHPQIRHGSCDMLSVHAVWPRSCAHCSDPAPVMSGCFGNMMQSNIAKMGPRKCKTLHFGHFCHILIDQQMLISFN